MPSIVGMDPFSISCVSWNIFVFPEWMSVYKPYEPLPGRQRELNDLPITFPLSWTKSVPNFVPYPRIFSSDPNPGQTFSSKTPLSRAAARGRASNILCLPCLDCWHYFSIVFILWKSWFNHKVSCFMYIPKLPFHYCSLLNWIIRLARISIQNWQNTTSWSESIIYKESL